MRGWGLYKAARLGNAAGAIQIAGTDAVTQLPFFITTCDYTLIGEELYAASEAGCRVDLIGPDISLEEVARRAGTINYEILTRLGQRAQRRFLGGPERDAKSRSG